MALINCKECQKTVSSQAANCPHCGAPVPKSSRRSLKPGVFIFAVFIAMLSMCSGNDKKTESAKCEKSDLNCRGNNATVLAGISCKSPIERQAKHNVKWVDGVLEPKFTHFRWADKDQELITVIGDKAEFQNGFGAYSRVVYECDLASDDQTVIAVRVRNGRL
jgi:hypothetical protein